MGNNRVGGKTMATVARSPCHLSSPRRSQGLNVKAVQEQSPLPRRKSVITTNKGMNMNVKGVTFILVDGRRDTANGREYLCMRWFPANTPLPVCLLQDYNRGVAQKNASRI